MFTQEETKATVYLGRADMLAILTTLLVCHGKTIVDAYNTAIDIEDLTLRSTL